MRRLVVAGVLAITAIMGTATSAGAWMEWCDWDPLVAVVTPAGNVVPVFDSVWTSSPLDVGLPLETYTTHRVYDAAGRPETRVDVTIYVPGGLLWSFPTTDEVTTGLLGSGQVLAHTSATSGHPAHLSFTLATP
jgi:hypothetical protein